MAPNPSTKHRRNLATPEPEPEPTPAATTTSDPVLTPKKKHHLLQQQQQQQKQKQKQPSFQHPDPKNPSGPSFSTHDYKLDTRSRAKSLNGSAEFDPEKLSSLVKKQQQQQGNHLKKGCAQSAGKVGGKEGVDIEAKLRRKFEEWEDLGKKLKEKEKVGALLVEKEGLRKSCDGEVETAGVRRQTTPASLIVNGGIGGRRRRSFGGVQVELSDVFASNGARVVSVDMPPFMQIHAVDCARKTCDSMEKFSSKTLALALKKEFDGVYGPAWHCIVGTSFGSFVTHSVGGFVYFAMDQKMYILLFKTTVQRAD